MYHNGAMTSGAVPQLQTKMIEKADLSFASSLCGSAVLLMGAIM